MSVKVMARVWKHSQRKDGELLVMLALADFANHAGECWPSIPVLAHKARLTERQTRRDLTKLEEAGEIRRNRSNGGRNRRNHYFITVSENSDKIIGKELAENPDKVTLKELQGKNNPVIGDQKTLTPMSGALNRHITVNKSASNKSTPVDGFKESMKLYSDLFNEKVGTKPDITATDGKILKDLLKAHGTAEVVNVVTYFFEHPPEWSKSKGKYTLAEIKRTYNEQLALMSKQATIMRNFG